MLMKFSAQIQCRLHTETRERFSNEKSLLAQLKGLFIKKEVTVIEETFSAPDILSRLNAALKNSGISNLIRVSHDDTEFYIDKNNQPNDLDRTIDEFNDLLRNSFERFYEKIAVIMEICHDGIDFMVELNLSRLHPVGEFPIQFYITGVPNPNQELQMDRAFELFVEKLEQNICKYIDISDIKRSFLKGYSFETETGPVEGNAKLKIGRVGRCNFFPLYGISLGETSVSELAEKGLQISDLDSCKKPYKCYKINDILFWHNDHKANQIYLTYTSALPDQWRKCGLDWELSYNEWMVLFEKLGFRISMVKNPQREWYNGKQTLVAEFHATKKIKKDLQLRVELCFNYSGKSSVMSKGTIYSLRFWA
jgi:hypothetical protein